MYNIVEDANGHKYCEVEVYEMKKRPNGDWDVTFKCPFCSVFYRKDGLPRVKPKICKHYHGMSQSNYEDGYATKSPHCLDDKFPTNLGASEFKIKVTPNTIIK